jgi:hypothetical protein
MLSRAAIHHERAQQAAATTVACAVDPDGGSGVWLSQGQQHEITTRYLRLCWTVGSHGEICRVHVVSRATGDTVARRPEWVASRLPAMIEHTERIERELRATWRKR